MRAVLFGLCAVCACAMCVLFAISGSAATPKNTDESALMQSEAVGDRWTDRWQGRQHYLYDDDNPPETTASGHATDAGACADEPVRMRRADGSTVVARINRCR
jgi:hypothetical protein